MKFLTDLGLYLHIPFCKKKCAYCDFYSGIFTEEMLDRYTDALIKSLKKWGGKLSRPINTLYLGGGTPSLLNHRLIPLLDAVRENFDVKSDAEITLEINPQPDIEAILENAKKAGVNRLSIGAQSSDAQTLKILGRTHTPDNTQNTVKIAKKLGFSNISLDLMIGLPNSNLETLKNDLDFLLGLEPQHISCYILKIEQNTAFYKLQNTLNLPDEDNVSDQYLFMCEYLKKNGFSHYEISNFCKNEMESKHNLKYWKCKEYLGLGPAAHSFINGKRFYYPKNLKEFINGNEPVFDAIGGETAEKLMLALRLSDGIETKNLPQKAINKCKLLAKNGLGILENDRFALTDKGMLVSNAIITEILEDF